VCDWRFFSYRLLKESETRMAVTNQITLRNITLSKKDAVSDNGIKVPYCNTEISAADLDARHCVETATAGNPRATVDDVMIERGMPKKLLASFSGNNAGLNILGHLGITVLCSRSKTERNGTDTTLFMNHAGHSESKGTPVHGIVNGGTTMFALKHLQKSIKAALWCGETESTEDGGYDEFRLEMAEIHKKNAEKLKVLNALMDKNELDDHEADILDRTVDWFDIERKWLPDSICNLKFPIRVIETNDRLLARMVNERQNTCEKVKPVSKMNWDGLFREVQTVLEQVPEISVRYNERQIGDWDVFQITKLIGYMLPVFARPTIDFDEEEEEATPKSSAIKGIASPNALYSGRSRMERILRAEYNPDASKRQSYGFVKLLPFLPEIMKLEAMLYADLPMAYNESYKGESGRAGMLKSDKGTPFFVNLKSPERVPLTDKTKQYDYARSLVVPIIHGFSANIQYDDEGVPSWKHEPAKLWGKVRKAVANKMMEELQEVRSIAFLNRERHIYDVCYAVVEKGVEFLNKKS